MISCQGIRKPEIFSENRFGTNKKILSSDGDLVQVFIPQCAQCFPSRVGRPDTGSPGISTLILWCSWNFGR